MIKLSLNSTEAKQSTSAPFSSALAAAVQAAGAAPTQVTVAPTGKAQKQAFTPTPSNGLLSRGIGWLQLKGRSKKRMQMIETVSLGEKRFVALVKVDGREFLLGGAPSSVGMLADLGAHGLGELLSVPMPVATDAKPMEMLPSVATQIEPSVEVPVARTAATTPAIAEIPVAVQPEAVNVKSLELPLPQAHITPNVLSAPSAPAAKLNIVVEADEDESEWLMEEENAVFQNPVVDANLISPVAKIETVEQPVATPISTPAIVIAEPEPTCVVVQAEKAAVIAPITPAPVASSMNLNFTFQMWPATQTAAPLAPAAEEPATVVVKARKHIDLESCPELLGEPYLLALVENTQGAAA